jgi:Flp pilus assembly protein TadG
MIFALSAPLLMFGTAFAVDFTNATIVRSKLNAAADAAALAALTPTMMQQSDDTAKAAAQQMFKARADTLGSLVTGQTNVTVTISHPANNAGIRIVEVDYSVQNNTIFSNILNAQTMGIHGTSTAQGAVPPNIDFYLLLDNSPSMALPATTAGITSMIGYTPTQDGGNGCAFACHQASTNNSDTQGNLCADGSTPPFPLCYSSGSNKGKVQTANQWCTADSNCSSSVAKQYSKYTNKAQMDNFALSRHYGISLRLDELTTGISTMLNTAWSSQNSGLYSAPPKYRFAAYSMDSLWSIGNPSNTLVMTQTTNGQDYRSAWTTASSNFGVMKMWANNSTCNNSSCTGAGSSGDVATNYDNAMSSINSTMPTPGYGTNLTGDKPQEVLFIVTDGVEDEQNINRLIQPINGNNGTNYCSQIKARGIRIAILYTEYLPVPTNSFYQSNVAPFHANIGPALQACASPNLYYDAAIGSDLGAALAQLFQTAVQPASLSN